VNAWWWLANLGAHWVQATVVVAAGALAAGVFRLRAPKVRLAYWQLLLALCLLLPAMQVWRRPAAGGLVEVRVGAGTISGPGVSRSFPWPEAALWTLAAGTSLRLLWLALGLARLRRYRRRSCLLDPLPSPVEAIVRQLGVEAQILVSSDVSGPVTFGRRCPVVLVPEQFLELEPGAQESIACHELLHVRRGDWAFTVVEEFVRALLWFHPAVWWVLGEIQLAREEVVDQEAVALTGARQQYLEALLSMVEGKAEAELAPAPLFLRRRHLSRRVVSLMEEVPMSARRIAGTLMGCLAVLVASGAWVVRAFPLQAPAPAEQFITIRSVGNLLHRAPIEYPAEARRKGVAGVVVLDVSVNEQGEVSDARVVGGPEELRRAALRSVLEWHYAKDMSLPARLQVAVEFQLPGSSTAASPGAVGWAGRLVEPGVLKRIRMSGLSETLRQNLQNRLPVREGDQLTADRQIQVQQTIREVDEHLVVVFGSSPDGIDLSIFLPGAREGVLGPKRVRVGGNVQSMMVVQSPPPKYPPLAKQARVQGTVELSTSIGKDGRVTDVQVISGHPLLTPAAVEAVKEWEYKPTLLNGEPVEVLTQVDVNFTLRP
jgi:TonB family protein